MSFPLFGDKFRFFFQPTLATLAHPTRAAATRTAEYPTGDPCAPASRDTKETLSLTANAASAKVKSP